LWKLPPAIRRLANGRMATLTAASGAIAPSIIETQIQESIRKLRGFAL